MARRLRRDRAQRRMIDLSWLSQQGFGFHCCTRYLVERHCENAELKKKEVTPYNFNFYGPFGDEAISACGAGIQTSLDAQQGRAATDQLHSHQLNSSSSSDMPPQKRCFLHPKKYHRTRACLIDRPLSFSDRSEHSTFSTFRNDHSWKIQEVVQRCRDSLKIGRTHLLSLNRSHSQSRGIFGTKYFEAMKPPSDSEPALPLFPFPFSAISESCSEGVWCVCVCVLEGMRGEGVG